MVLHLDKKNSILAEEIIAILDFDHIKDFNIFSNLTKKTNDNAKSIVVTSEKGKSSIYFSRVSSCALARRCNL